MYELDWGNVPTWVGSVLTSSSVLVASLAYRRNVHDKEKEQAASVYAAVHTTVDGERRLLVTNGSSAPVYSLRVQALQAPELKYSHLPGNSTEDILLPPLGPDAAKELVQSQMPKWLLKMYDLEFADALSVEPMPTMHYRDSSGRWWKRSRSGKLKRSHSHTSLIKRARMTGMPFIIDACWDEDSAKLRYRYVSRRKSHDIADTTAVDTTEVGAS